MPEWQQFDPTDLFPADVSSALGNLGDVVDALATGLSGLGLVVDTIATFASGMDDINQLLISQAQTLINGLFQQLTQTGVYWLFHASPSVSYEMTPSNWLVQVSASLYDRMDENRPILVDPNAYVGAVVVMATSENLNDLLTEFYQMLELLQRTFATLGQIQDWPELDEQFTVVPGVGKDPNWEQKAVVDIVPGLAEIAEKMTSFANSLFGPTAAGDIYSAFADALTSKASYLTGFVAEIETLLNTISVILNFEGAFVLPIYGQGDADWLSAQLQNSTGGPMDVEDANYSVGAMFLCTGGTSTPVDVLFDLFNLPKEVTS